MLGWHLCGNRAQIVEETPVSESDSRAVSARDWLLAARPFAFPHTAVPVVLGAGVAHYGGKPLRWGLLAVTVVGVLLFHTATNMLNDYWDYRRGLDTEADPGSGALVRGTLTPRQVFWAAVAALVLGAACGLYLVAVAGWPVLALGAAGAFIGVEYTAPPARLKDRGLGDLAVFLGCGPVPVCGSYWVQARHFSAMPILWSIPPALLVVATLHANNWRDMEADLAGGCRTVAGLLGDRGSAAYYHALIFTPFVLVGGYVAAGYGPAVGLVSFLALPLCARMAADTAKRDAETREVRMRFRSLDTRTATAGLAFGSLLAAAFFGARYLS